MSDDPKSEPPPPERFDPWAPQSRGRTARFFAVSTLVHVGILLLLATVTMQIVRKVEEIRVKVMDEEVPGFEEDIDGAPSMEDLAGVLKVSKSQARQARAAGPKFAPVRAPEMPRVAGVGPKIGGPVVDDIPLAFGVGSGGGGLGGLGGLSGGFGDYVGGLRKVGLDVVLVIDTTESMQFAIDEVKEKFASFVAALQRMVPATRVGIVIYRDSGDDYVVKWTDLSFKTAKLQEFLKNVRAGGGGDWEEAVSDGMEAAINDMSWRKKSKRLIILVGGSPPHPWEVDGVLDLVASFHSQGGAVSAVDVTERLHYEHDYWLWRSLKGSRPYEPKPMPDYYKQTAEVYQQIAKKGGGELISLEKDKTLIREVLVLTFGSRWKTEMSKFLKELS